MALIKCKECGKEISSTVKVCPHCGYKKKPSKITYLIVLIIGIVGGYIYLSNKHDFAGKEVKEQAEQQVKSLFNETEANVYKTVAKSWLVNIDNGQQSIVETLGLFTLPLKVTADKLQKDYEKNEVKADSDYKNKTLIVTGKIDAIQKDAFNNMLLKLVGGSNMFLYPSATVDKKYTDWVSGLNKGENVKLVCSGKSFVMGSASLGDCVPFKRWLENQNLDAVLLNEYKNNPNGHSKAVIDLVKDVTPLLSENSACKTNGYDVGKCLTEISSIYSKINK